MKFHRTFRVNPEWWKTGEGEMFIKLEEKPQEAQAPMGVKILDMDVWQVIKLNSEILGLEFRNLWDMIHEMQRAPKREPKTNNK